MTTLTKTEKIASLAGAMETKTRGDDTEFACFTDEAPESLQAVFRDNYEIRDVDYLAFYDAVTIVDEVLSDADNNTDDKITDAINERESASVYTFDRLSYLNVHNQDEVSDILKHEGAEDIAQACAIWYDRRVIEACDLITSWINS